jgi:inosine/xanthosine triphosphate pyrophosphatase family protein
MFQTDLDGRITREKVGKAWMYTIRRPEAEEPAPQTWDQFVGTYRATDAPLPENHSKLIAGMVAWADDHGFDVEKIIGAPKEATEIWLATAKNCRGQTVAGNIQRENTAKILQRFGDGRRHSIAAMASSLSLKEKFLAVILDMMFRADFKGMVAREPDGKSLKYTIRRRTKEVAQ